MSWKNQLRSDSTSWLLESENPGVRYLAMRDLLDLAPDDKKLKSARKLAHKEGRWALEYNYDGKTWMRFGKMKEPNEWVTLRALRVLRSAA